MNPILLLHGALGTAQQLTPIATALSHVSEPIVSMNFSGHGHTPFSKSGFGIEVFADEIMSFLNHHNLPFVDVFGYSMGGYAALYAAAQWPSRFRKIAVLGTKFDWTPEQSKIEIQKLDASTIQEKVPQFADHIKQQHGDPDWKQLLKETATMMTALGSRSLLDEATLGAVQQEVLVLTGDRDTMANAAIAENIAQQIPFGTFKLLNNTPHALEKVHTDTLQKILADFYR